MRSATLSLRDLNELINLYKYGDKLKFESILNKDDLSFFSKDNTFNNMEKQLSETISKIM